MTLYLSNPSLNSTEYIAILEEIEKIVYWRNRRDGKLKVEEALFEN